MESDIASMGPRSIDRGIWHPGSRPRPESWLQWGRDQLIAELSTVRLGKDGNWWLQWGRDQLIAELIQSFAVFRCTSLLQWGRDQLIAEF